MSAEGPKTAEPSLRFVKIAYEEPWAIGRGDLSQHGRHLYTRTGRRNCVVETPEEARRIVACVNAMVGISTEALEQLPGDIETFVATLKAGRNGGRHDH
jgi:hypothetical protein